MTSAVGDIPIVVNAPFGLDDDADYCEWCLDSGYASNVDASLSGDLYRAPLVPRWDLQYAFKNIIGIKVIEAFIPYSFYNVEAGQAVDLVDGSGTYTGL